MPNCDAPPSFQNSAMPQLVPGHSSSSDAGVVVANLSFAYPGHEECISDLSFQLPL